MSAIIKGIKKSSACEWCGFICGSGMDWYCGVGKFMIYDYKSVHKDCPLINIPTPHGRLIDADAIMDLLEKSVPEKNRGHQFYAFRHMLRNAPTIIEPEE